MIRILVADKLASQALDRLKSTDDVEADVRLGLSPEELADVVGDYDGMIIRSSVKVTAAVLEKAGRLKAIARAGVGVDNVDLAAATTAGVLVMNTPDANTVSTAEHALALLFSLMRHIPDAHRHVVSGEWNRSAFTGHQLAGKTLGVIGMGRVGQAVAKRALACDMCVIGYDPLIGASVVMDGAVKLVGDLDEMLSRSDCVTLHAKVTPETRGMIGAERLSKMKPTAVLVNCARGDLVDEQALADALNGERIAGAAVDVYTQEPPVGNPLLSAKNIVLTPHLGASTTEAQTAVSLEAAEELCDYLKNEEVRSAVNLVGMVGHLSDVDRLYVDLSRRMGMVLSAWCATGISRLRVTTRGDAGQRLATALARQCMVELLSPHIHTRLNLVNADAVARERGIEIESVAHDAAGDVGDNVVATIETREGSHEVEGTVFNDGRPRILAIDGYRMDMVPERVLVLIFNDDQPGMIGLVGGVMGEHAINIADMTLSRRDQTALMLLKLDQVPDDAILARLRESAGIHSVRSVLLPPLDTSARKP